MVNVQRTIQVIHESRFELDRIIKGRTLFRVTDVLWNVTKSTAQLFPVPEITLPHHCNLQGAGAANDRRRHQYREKEGFQYG